jgi:hypothetical protein
MHNRQEKVKSSLGKMAGKMRVYPAGAAILRSGTRQTAPLTGWIT